MQIVEVTHEYDTRLNATCRIVGLGDIHRGNPWFDEDHFYRTLDWIEENDCKVILMGDYGECINAKDPRHDYNAIDWEYATPDKQYMKVTEDLERIKHKCIMMLEGNHESNFWRRHNHNYTSGMAKALDIPYVGISGYILLRFKHLTKEGKPATRRIFRIYAHHGWAGGRSDGYKVKVIQDLRNIFDDAHLYMMGHTHKRGSVFPTTTLRVNARTKKIQDHDKNYVYTGSYIKGHEVGKGSYVEARAYPPTQLGSPLIEIRPKITGGTSDRTTSAFSVRCVDLDWV